MLKPADFTENIVRENAENSLAVSFVAREIMEILSCNGNIWRVLSSDEYRDERQRDGVQSELEEVYFDTAVKYTVSPEEAANFCQDWKAIFDADAEATFGGQ